LELEKENLKLLDPPHTEPPDDVQIFIMRQLTHPYYPVPCKHLSGALNMPLPLLDYQADLLRKAGYVQYHALPMPEGPKLSLTHKGRTFLFERKLLTPP
jgi:hypothetical protein